VVNDDALPLNESDQDQLTQWHGAKLFDRRLASRFAAFVQGEVDMVAANSIDRAVQECAPDGVYV